MAQASGVDIEKRDRYSQGQRSRLSRKSKTKLSPEIGPVSKRTGSDVWPGQRDYGRDPVWFLYGVL